MRAASSRQGRARLGALVLAAAGVVAFAGCDVSEDSDLERGRALFQTKCGSCHKLAQAGTAGDLGPDLDAAFADSRASGMDNDTIEGVVQAQISNPRQIEEGTPNYDNVFMPADIVTDQDAEDVAAYVGSVAGVPGAAPPQLTAGEQFVESCGSCHTLAAAGTGGTTGPDLDDVLPGQDAKQIEESIVDPSAQLAQGFGDVMPGNFEQLLGPDGVKAMVQYLMENAGNGGGSP
jgi:mono/diheme cytochrome c family protein